MFMSEVATVPGLMMTTSTVSTVSGVLARDRQTDRQIDRQTDRPPPTHTHTHTRARAHAHAHGLVYSELFKVA